MGEWEGFGIPREEFNGVRKTRAEKPVRYDLWAVLSSLKTDITFGQLLEISPMAHKTLKEGMPMTRTTRIIKTRVAAIVQLQGGGHDVKVVEIEVIVVHKVLPNVLLDGGSGLHILTEHTMKKNRPQFDNSITFHHQHGQSKSRNASGDD